MFAHLVKWFGVGVCIAAGLDFVGVDNDASRFLLACGFIGLAMLIAEDV